MKWFQPNYQSWFKARTSVCDCTTEKITANRFVSVFCLRSLPAFSLFRNQITDQKDNIGHHGLQPRDLGSLHHGLWFLPAVLWGGHITPLCTSRASQPVTNDHLHLMPLWLQSPSSNPCLTRFKKEPEQEKSFTKDFFLPCQVLAWTFGRKNSQISELSEHCTTLKKHFCNFSWAIDQSKF